MEKTPMTVKLIGRNREYYQIKFPNLQIPVRVNDELYEKMKNSDQYEFIGST